jgi:GNAT superfamily N-acetyltransferase
VGALPGYVRAFGRRLGVCARYASAAVRAHPREQPHWYLAIIGVDPSRQGSGAGAALLRSRLERCDKEGMAAYLESSNPQNVRSRVVTASSGVLRAYWAEATWYPSA